MISQFRHFLAFLLIATYCWSYGQNTIGTIEIGDGIQEGYTLFAPSSSRTSYLVDNCGHVVNSWESQMTPGLSAYLTPEGNLVRTRRENNNTFFAGGVGGGIEIFNWDGEVIWEYILSNENNVLHHDIAILPNGNILAIAFERISQAEALSLGRRLDLTANNGLWTDVIIEIEVLPNFQHEIVWKWRAIDHVMQSENPNLPNFGNSFDFPERLDINYFIGTQSATSILDWMHSNAIDYNPDLDQIILNSRNYSEFYIIDHSTTTEEASTSEGGKSGRGGDLLYRWGNPQAYGAGTAADRKLFSQHDAHWIDEGLEDAGKVFVFNNGLDRPGGLVSSVDIIAPPLQEDGSYLMDGIRFGPEEAEWVYGLGVDDENINSGRISGVGRQANGNTLITVGGSGELIEIDREKNVVWRYILPLRGAMPNTQGEPPAVNTTFRSYKYPLDYPAFTNNDISLGDPIELNPDNTFCLLLPVSEADTQATSIELFGNLVDQELRLYANQEFVINILDINGQVRQTFDLQVGEQTLVLPNNLAPGMYFIRPAKPNSAIFVNERFIKI